MAMLVITRWKQKNVAMLVNIVSPFFFRFQEEIEVYSHILAGLKPLVRGKLDAEVAVLFSHRKTIGKWWFSMRFNGVIPGNDCDIAIEHGQSKVREFSHENWWICWLCKRLPEGRNTINSH